MHATIAKWQPVSIEWSLWQHLKWLHIYMQPPLFSYLLQLTVNSSHLKERWKRKQLLGTCRDRLPSIKAFTPAECKPLSDTGADNKTQKQLLGT